MPETVPADSFLYLAQSLPVIDVRSPGEYAEGHIPGAHNVPLFDNDERAEVGTLYKHQGRRPAILRGLEIAGGKLAWYVRETLKISPDEDVLVHCWRGGMRSSSFAWFLESADVKARVLEGGYKAYRHFIRSSFAAAKRIVILSGMTGTGKTEILKRLAERGEQVVDLEGLANHKGSAFGAIGQDEQPTTEQFENNTAALWLTLDVSRRIWIEDESLKIGRCVINDVLYGMMRQAPVIAIDIPLARRIERLVNEYCIIPPEALVSVVYRIQRRLGDVRTKQTIESLQSGDYRRAIEVLLDYYDRAYRHGRSRRDPATVTDYAFNDESTGQIADDLIRRADRAGF
ncbi:MAG: tRNA 2-selenouridine(34) synthase MnmH [Spirochaetota bacterium]